MNLIGKQFLAPGETDSFTVDYSDDWESGDTITSTAATTDGDAMLTVVYAIYTNGVCPYVKVMLTGGTPGTRYTVTVTTKTQGGRTLIDQFYVTVK